MAMITDASLAWETEAEGLAFAREVLRIEAEALDRVRERLDSTIARAAERVFRCRGSVIVTGMGKAGIVGQKLAATLASTGTRAFPLHPGRGHPRRPRPDPGRRRGHRPLAERRDRGGPPAGPGAPAARRRSWSRSPSEPSSSLGRAADLCIALGPIEEACPLGLAPSASTTAMMAVGDALALLVSRMRDFRAEDFALYHPGGNLGRRLAYVEDLMRTDGRLRKAHAGAHRPRGLRQPGRAEAALGGGPDRRRRRTGSSGSSPTPTSPASSSVARTTTSTGRSPR